MKSNGSISGKEAFVMERARGGSTVERLLFPVLEFIQVVRRSDLRVETEGGFREKMRMRIMMSVSEVGV